MTEQTTFWKKRLALFLASQAISLFGSSLVQYAILWKITLDTQSGSMMTLYLLFGFLPTFFLSPFGGVWADRYNRKRLIMLSDGMIAFSTLILAILFFNGYQALWLLFVIPVIRALGSAIHAPAASAFLPQFVPEDQLMKANGLFSSLQSVIMLLSPMVSGALFTFASFEVILLIDVVTALMAILVLLTLKVPAHVRKVVAPGQKYWHDMKDGLVYIREHSYIKRFFIFSGIYFFLVTPAAILTPLQVTRSFGEDVWRLTAIEVAFSSGMLGGGLLIAAWGGFRNRVKTMVLATLVVAITTFLLGVVSNFWIYLAIIALVGIAIPNFHTPATVLLQEKVEADYLGRVFGVMGMIASGMMPIAMFIFGPLADVISIEWQLIVTGLLLLVLGFGLYLNKIMMVAGEPLPKPEMAEVSTSDELPSA